MSGISNKKWERTDFSRISSNCESIFYKKVSLRSSNDGVAVSPTQRITNLTPTAEPIIPSNQVMGFFMRTTHNGSMTLSFVSSTISSVIWSAMPSMSPSLAFSAISPTTFTIRAMAIIDKISERGITIFFTLSLPQHIFVIPGLNNFFYGCPKINKNHFVFTTDFAWGALLITVDAKVEMRKKPVSTGENWLPPL